VAVIGLGYVGLPLAAAFARAGFRVVGFDLDVRKVDALLAQKNYLPHLADSDLAPLFTPNPTHPPSPPFSTPLPFAPTSDPSLLQHADAFVICVPTPLGEHQEPDLSYVLAAGDAIARALRPGALVVLESTTYPGTTDEDLRARLDASALTLGAEYFLAYAPEREDPGNAQFKICGIPKVVGGVDPPSTAAAAALYRGVFSDVREVSSARVAESSKLVENVYRCVNIALVNELKIAFERLGVDVWEVLDAAATKPFGFHRFDPGPGWGGHCIPIDPLYLTWKANAAGAQTHFIARAAEINRQMPE
jgi:UDP-N-acetyl-D-glucosamine dehydrogenase